MQYAQAGNLQTLHILVLKTSLQVTGNTRPRITCCNVLSCICHARHLDKICKCFQNFLETESRVCGKQHEENYP